MGRPRGSKNKLPYSAAALDRMSRVKRGPLNPMFGRIASEATRRKLSASRVGARNHQWRGGRKLMKSGYVWRRMPDGRQGYEHRLVMAEMLGRPLLRTEVVHHVDHDRQNNDPGNLMLFASHAEHAAYHARLCRCA